MMGGIAVAMAGGSASEINFASQAAANTAAKNWLATQQQAQMKKEMDGAKTVAEKLQVFGKWAIVSGKQDALTASGVGKGLVEAGISDVQGLAEFLAHPVEGLSGLKQIISSPEARQQLGDSVFAELDAKIGHMQTALEVGGDQNAEQLGKDLGGLIWQVGSVVMGAGAAAKGGVAIASAAAATGTRALENSTLQFMKLDAGAIKGFKSAEEVNALMNAAEWSPAWKAGTSVAEVTIKPGTTVQMVITEAAYNALRDGNPERAFGGWATLDEVPNLTYARNDLAITGGMKASDTQLYVVEVKVTKAINAQTGKVGEQGSSAGGGNQLHFFLPASDRPAIFEYISDSARAMK